MSAGMWGPLVAAIGVIATILLHRDSTKRTNQARMSDTLQKLADAVSRADVINNEASWSPPKGTKSPSGFEQMLQLHARAREQSEAVTQLVFLAAEVAALRKKGAEVGVFGLQALSVAFAYAYDSVNSDYYWEELIKATGKGWGSGQMVAHFRALTGRAAYRYHTGRPGDIEDARADIDNAVDLLMQSQVVHDWAAEVSAMCRAQQASMEKMRGDQERWVEYFNKAMALSGEIKGEVRRSVCQSLIQAQRTT